MARMLSHSDLTQGNTKAGDTFTVTFTFPENVNFLELSQYIHSSLGENTVTTMVAASEKITLRGTVPADGAALDLVDLIASSPIEDEFLGSINYEFLD